MVSNGVSKGHHLWDGTIGFWDGIRDNVDVHDCNRERRISPITTLDKSPGKDLKERVSLTWMRMGRNCKLEDAYGFLRFSDFTCEMVP